MIFLGVRIVGGPRHNIGVLQIQRGSDWMEVTDEHFDERAAEVACR